jgi:hypothetical protein
MTHFGERELEKDTVLIQGRLLAEQYKVKVNKEDVERPSRVSCTFVHTKIR